VIELFYSYSHKDEKLRDKLETHLAMLKREGVIKGWHDRKIIGGEEWAGKIDEHMNSAEIILLLVSSDFLASNYCYDIEVKLAMKRHEAGEARVIPIILRPCDWQQAAFGKVQAFPKNAKPVTRWDNRDEALLDVAQGIRNVVEEISSQNRTATSTLAPTETVKPATHLLNIPRPPRIGFVARRDEDGRDIVERLKEELAPQGSQLVTLCGPGGVGKTTLAAETARALRDVFNGRIVWSSAAGRTDFTLSTLLDEIATQLGREDLRPLAPDAKAAEVHALVAAPPALVILDNYETIADEAKKNIEEWFSRAQCPALFTSRHRINSTLYVKLAAMPREEAQEFLEKVIGQTQDAQVFSDEVRQRIYETAGATPFVMQWIVAQIDQAQEPDTVLEELQQGEGDAAERVFDRSFNLPQLGDDGRAALLALSLFAPSATRDALTEVAGFDDVKRTNEAVKNLHSLWLVRAIDENRRLTIEGLTRSLAKARLAKDDRAAEFRQRFVAYFLGYAKAHAQLVPEDFDALETEKDNVLGAMDVAFEMEDWLKVMWIANVLTESASGMLNVRGYWNEAIRLGEQAVVAAQKAKDEWAVAQFAGNTAIVRNNRGEYDEAKRGYQQALVAFRKLGSEANVAVSLHLLAMIAQDQGELAEARRLYDESLEIRKNLDDQSGIAGTLHQLGTLAYAQEDWAEARRLYDESLEISKSLGNRSNVAITLYTLANLLCAQGEFIEARRLYEESLAIAEKLGDKGNLAMIFYNLGRLTEMEGNKAEAVRLWRESLSMFEKLGSPYAETVQRELERVEGESS
jgi:tetratricopeptide (TPR) repeat protein